MPTGLYDITDREPVLTPDEMNAGRDQCLAQGLTHIRGPNGKAFPLADYLTLLGMRWHRAVATSRIIDAIRAGYCSVDVPTAPPTSNARH